MQVRLRGSVSSQFLTALLMAAPLAVGEGSTEIIIADELVSQPYVAMTLRLMERFGVQVLLQRDCPAVVHLKAIGSQHGSKMLPSRWGLRPIHGCHQCNSALMMLC